MRKLFFPACLSVLALLLVPSAFAGVTISSPGNGASVKSPVHFVASSSTTNCSKGVAAMGVYDDNVLMATSDGSKFDKDVALTSGIHDNTVVQYWDYCGNSGKKADYCERQQRLHFHRHFKFRQDYFQYRRP
jgi:hypothetical protein